MLVVDLGKRKLLTITEIHFTVHILFRERGDVMKKIIIVILSIAALGIVLAVVLSLIREGIKLPGYF